MTTLTQPAADVKSKLSIADNAILPIGELAGDFTYPKGRQEIGVLIELAGG